MNLQKITKKLPALHAWLAGHGAEVLQPTNEWEVLRFKARGVTAVVYRTKAGQITFIGDAKEALQAFFTGGAWSAGVATARKQRRPVEVETLLRRDGDRCFLCRQPLGEDITIEHLVAVVHGGPQHIANKVLAHERCNQRMHHLSVMEKIAMRERGAL